MRRHRRGFSLGRAIGSDRAIAALVLVALWLGGWVGQPLVHRVMHAALAPHVHEGGHALGGGHLAQASQAHRAEHALRAKTRAVASIDEAPSDPLHHGDGSFLHGDVGVLTPPAALPIPHFVVCAVAPAPAVVSDAPLAPPRLRSRARAPPLG